MVDETTALCDAGIVALHGTYACGSLMHLLLGCIFFPSDIIDYTNFGHLKSIKAVGLKVYKPWITD